MTDAYQCLCFRFGWLVYHDVPSHLPVFLVVKAAVCCVHAQIMQLSLFYIIHYAVEPL